MTPARSRTIRLQVFLEASPKKVFRAISEPKRLARWLLDEATLTPRKGGKYAFRWEGGPTHTGRVLEYARGKRLSISWQWPGQERLGETRLRMDIARRDGGSILRFVHSGFGSTDPWSELYYASIHGWTYFLMNLKSVLQHGHDLRSDNDW